MLRAWEIAKLKRELKELKERSHERQNKESELEIELARYKQEAQKIPDICQYAPCEVGVCYITICPNWIEGGKEDV